MEYKVQNALQLIPMELLFMIFSIVQQLSIPFQQDEEEEVGLGDFFSAY